MVFNIDKSIPKKEVFKYARWLHQNSWAFDNKSKEFMLDAYSRFKNSVLKFSDGRINDFQKINVDNILKWFEADIKNMEPNSVKFMYEMWICKLRSVLANRCWRYECIKSRVRIYKNKKYTYDYSNKFRLICYDDDGEYLNAYEVKLSEKDAKWLTGKS